MDQLDVAALLVEAYFDLLLDSGSSFHRLEQTQAAGDGFSLHGHVVRPIRPRHRLRSVPQAMASIGAPLVSAGFSNLRGIFEELVLAPDEPIADHARAHVCGHDDFDCSVTDAIAVRPALVSGLLD